MKQRRIVRAVRMEGPTGRRDELGRHYVLTFAERRLGIRGECATCGWLGDWHAFAPEARQAAAADAYQHRDEMEANE